MNQSKPPVRLRSKDILSIFSARTGWRLARGVIRAAFEADFSGAPLAVCWFTNFTCNAHCPFCCKAKEIAGGDSRFVPLSPEKALVLLEKIRLKVNLLYISGGEPTFHPHIEEILGAARSLAFDSVGISSNLILLDEKPGILDHISVIGCSIHSPSVKIHAKSLGVPQKTAERVFANLESLKTVAGQKGIRVLLNCVVTPWNMDTVRQMVDFAGERGFLLEIAPANEHGQIPRGLHKNPKYVKLVNDLLALRKSGKAPHLAGSTHYYKTIRDFKPYRCFPYGVANIMPDGSLCTPCDVSGQYGVNVLNHEDLGHAVKASMPYLGSYPCREGKCFKAGIVERSRLFGLLAPTLYW